MRAMGVVLFIIVSFIALCLWASTWPLPPVQPQETKGQQIARVCASIYGGEADEVQACQVREAALALQRQDAEKLIQADRASR